MIFFITPFCKGYISFHFKISAELLPRARDQPRVVTRMHPITKSAHSQSQEVTDIVTTHYMKELQRVTPDHLPKAPWTQPHNPDNSKIIPLPRNTSSNPATTLDTYITWSHYDMTTTRAPEGKAPGPDAITNELIIYLPEASRRLLYTLFQIVAKYNYTPKE